MSALGKVESALSSLSALHQHPNRIGMDFQSIGVGVYCFSTQPFAHLLEPRGWVATYNPVRSRVPLIDQLVETFFTFGSELRNLLLMDV